MTFTPGSPGSETAAAPAPAAATAAGRETAELRPAHDNTAAVHQDPAG